jgi:hypothetical protein
MIAENFGRFFHLSEGNISYDLGHENGAWYNLVTLIAGFAPWTLLLFFSLFGLKISKPDNPFKQWFKKVWTNILAMDKIKLFCLVASVCIVFFYSIPSSKRSVYLMPAYPFIALFIAQYFIYLAEYRTHIFRLFAGTLLMIASIVIAVVATQLIGIVDFNHLIAGYIIQQATLEQVRAVTHSFAPGILQFSIYLILIIAVGTLSYQLRKKINIKILYASILLVFSLNLFIDGVVMPSVRNNASSRPFAEEIVRDFPLSKSNVYVMNDLQNYGNLYGMNFYMGNSFHNFEFEQPQTGFFLSTERDYPKILQNYAGKYTFVILRTSDCIISDSRSKIVLSNFSNDNQ